MREAELLALPRPALGFAAIAAARTAGDMQYDNAATAIAALEELDSRLPVPATAVAQGLTAVRLVGTLSSRSPPPARPTWILDVAHNPGAAARARRNLRGAAERGPDACGVRNSRRQGCRGHRRGTRGCIDAWWLRIDRGRARHDSARAGGAIAAAGRGAARTRSRQHCGRLRSGGAAARPGIGSWCSVRSTRSGRHWIGSRPAASCRRPTPSRIYCAAQ